MNNSRIMLACYDKGVGRALESAAGKWSIEYTLEGYRVTCLAEDPSNQGVVYAGTHDQGVWRSADYGKTWVASGMQGQIVKSLAVSPVDSSLLFAGVKPAGVFRSRDGGRTWQEMEGFKRIPNRWWWFSPAEPPDMRPYVIALALSPDDPDVLLAGVEFGGVFRSNDGGETWSRHLRGAVRDCHSLKFHPTEGDFVYQAGGSGGGASWSRDAGLTWQKAGRGLTKHYGIVCGTDRFDPERWYVCVGPSPGKAFGADPSSYLYRSDPVSGAWQPIGWEPHPLHSTPTALVPGDAGSGHLYAGLKDGQVWETRDGGETWSKLDFKLEGIWYSLLVLGA
jgi:hypothetical protein